VASCGAPGSPGGVSLLLLQSRVRARHEFFPGVAYVTLPCPALFTLCPGPNALSPHHLTLACWHIIPFGADIPSGTPYPMRPGLCGPKIPSLLPGNAGYRKYESARLQGFEASGRLLSPLVAGPRYQAVLRQSSKGYSTGAYCLNSTPTTLGLSSRSSTTRNRMSGTCSNGIELPPGPRVCIRVHRYSPGT
jgi:hypothetical protein